MEVIFTVRITELIFWISWAVAGVVLLINILQVIFKKRINKRLREKHYTDRDFWWLDMLQEHFRWIERANNNFKSKHWGRTRAYLSVLDQVRIMEDKIDNTIKRHYDKQERRFKKEIEEETKNE